MNFGNNTRYDPILDPDFDSLFLEDLEQQFDSKSENDYSFKNFTNNELQPQEQQETNQNSNSEKSQSQNNLNSTNNTSNNETDLNSSVEGLIKLGSLRHVPSLESSFSTFNSDPISSIILDQMNNEDDYYENNPIVLKKQRKQPITIPLPEEQTQQKSILYPERKISMEAILKHQNSGNFNPFQPQLDFQMQFQNSNYEMDSSESRSGFVPEFEPDEDDEGDSSYDPNSSKIQIANSNKIEIENNKEKKKKINKQFNFKNKIEKNRKNLKIKKKTKKTTKKEKGTKNNTKNKNKNQNQSKNIKKKVKFKKVEEEFDQKMLKGLSLEDPKLRKRDLKIKTNKQNSLRRLDSTVVESGKEVFKLLTGILWAISGGASQKFLTPYTKKFANKIGTVFNASENETNNFQSQLKYLLSNSRRTFTEFILEILLGLLSLIYNDEETPDFCNELWAILIEINKFNSNNNNNNNEGGKEREKEKEKLKQRLEKIYQQNISYDILLYWFNKRFVDRLNVYFANEPQQKFCEKYLFYLGKSKFILSCLLLPSELIKKDGIVKQYYQLINKNYDGNPLNLYFNNRGKKVKLVKSLILAYGVNNGKYWEIISKDFCEKLEFNVDNIFEHFPFKQIISNPGLSNLCTKNVIEDIPPKKRTVVNQNDTKIGVKIRVDWLLKKRLI